MALLRNLAFKRRITYLTIYSINVGGVFPIKSQAHIFVRYLWVIFTTFETFYMCGLSVVAPFFEKYDFTVTTSIVLNILTSLVCYCNPVISLFCRPTLVKLIQLIDAGLYTYTDEKNFKLREYDAQKLLVKELYLCGFVMITYIGMTLTPLIMVLLLRDHVNTVIDLLYVAWVPFGIETKQQFFFSYIMQWISTIPLYTSFISKILFINHINKEFEFQCDKLKFALSTIAQRVSKKEILLDEEFVGKKGDANIIEKCDETEILQRLAECEEHYYQLQRCMNFFSSWYNLIFSCELAYGFLSFALIGYVLIQGTGNRATDAKYVCLLGLFGGQLCYQCVSGEIFLTLEEKVLLAVYSIPWYNQTPRFKKNVQMFLHELQHKKKLRGFKLYTSSIEIFTTIVKTSYSYLSILNKIMHK